MAFPHGKNTFDAEIICTAGVMDLGNAQVQLQFNCESLKLVYYLDY